MICKYCNEPVEQRPEIYGKTWVHAENGVINCDTEATPVSESNLVYHARQELELIGEEPETIEGYLRIIQAFADMGHSGGSASVAIPTINELLRFRNLSSLTNDPVEWMEVGNDMWQSTRRADAFSTDGGKTYYVLNEDEECRCHDGRHIFQSRSRNREPQSQMETIITADDTEDLDMFRRIDDEDETECR